MKVKEPIKTADRLNSFPPAIAFLLLMLFSACSSDDTLFRKKKSSQTGIHFNNVVIENDSINPLDLEFLYNGGGVAAADFNNDGLTDLYFTASTTANVLYLNEGGFTFKDVTKQALVDGDGRWANGSAVVDINADGLQDIYVCNSIYPDAMRRRNLLYVNQGPGSDGVPVFKEMSSEYGLADSSYSVQAAFFDYDNDGDLDMYLVTTMLAKRNGARFFTGNNAGDTSRIDLDKLYRNDWNDSLKHPVYTDVSKEAGIVHIGFGLGITVADINLDGWKDVYVTNDFYGSDLLYINNRNGTFSEKANECLKHTSQNAMGNDVADINNDGLADIIAVDMNPEDNYRKKKNMNASNYNIYQNMITGGYNIQYVRNTLQLNMGAVVTGDSVGDPIFGDISFLSGVAETDWSWNPSMADMDFDGYRDIIITNGYPRDVTDHDFAAYRGSMGNVATKDQLLEKIPVIKVSNYAFRNKGDLQFENVTERWGLKDLSFSNGAVYADLDNDGDLDYVINNINEEALVYENLLNEEEEGERNGYLKIRYKGAKQNTSGIGAFATVYYDSGVSQVHENLPVRGYLSCVEPYTYFGVGKSAKIDSLVVTWPDQRQQVIHDVGINKELIVDYNNSNVNSALTLPIPPRDLQDITEKVGINYIHRETDHIDFNEQRLLPHKLSQFGPGLAAGDIDGNGFDDILIGGTGDNQGKFFLQQLDGAFVQQALPIKNWSDARNSENMGILLFDADKDGDLDVYFANGSNEFIENAKDYQDALLVNDGKGKMRWDTLALPSNRTSKSCVKAADFDSDGDLDLFVGGRLRPGHYPEAVNSFLYRNDSENGIIKFTDVTRQLAPGLEKLGMVCDALWTDIDNNGTPDLLLAGEWMPLTIFKNVNGKFENITKASGLSSKVGWWNSLTPGDFDNDGDIDYIAGNLGNNSYFRAREGQPVRLYAKDFDNNGRVDIVPTMYMPDQNGRMAEFPSHTRDDIIEQLPGLRKNFLTYKDFASVDVRGIFDKQLNEAFTLEANYFTSSYIRNDGNGTFTITALPVAFQLSPLYGMVAEDVNADGFLDIIGCGNDFGNEVANGRYDAMNGIVAYGDGKGNFSARTINESGFYVPGDAKALVALRSADSSILFAASQNRGPLKIFRSGKSSSNLSIPDDIQHMIITLENGSSRKQERYHGSSFLSQSSGFVNANRAVRSVEGVSRTGKKTIYQR